MMNDGTNQKKQGMCRQEQPQEERVAVQKQTFLDKLVIVSLNGNVLIGLHQRKDAHMMHSNSIKYSNPFSHNRNAILFFTVSFTPCSIWILSAKLNLRIWHPSNKKYNVICYIYNHTAVCTAYACVCKKEGFKNVFITIGH